MAVLSSFDDYWFLPADPADTEAEEIIFWEGQWLSAVTMHRPYDCDSIQNKRCEHCKRIFGDDLFIWKIRVYFAGKGDDALPSE